MKKTNLSWVGALLVFALLLWCTAATPGTIADPASYTPAVYSSMLSLLPPVVAIVLALNTKADAVSAARSARLLPAAGAGPPLHRARLLLPLRAGSGHCRCCPAS